MQTDRTSPFVKLGSFSIDDEKGNDNATNQEFDWLNEKK